MATLATFLEPKTAIQELGHTQTDTTTVTATKTTTSATTAAATI